ncbi:tetratricopeptide repeat protein, partial [Geminisphaera colitermitum]|uniref:tetratricopeptide repeat protein n=1 Tax=Geminisphaera colitermitum TaxID=1148786 RepID=UPI000693ADDD
ELTERVSAKLGELRTLADAGNYTAALALVDALLPAAAPETFDLAFLSQLKGQLLLNLKRYPSAIDPLETSLQLGDRHSFFDTTARLNTLHTLSQLYFQEAAETTDPDARQRNYGLAYDRIQRWLALTPRPTAEAQLYAASILYSDATRDPAHPDLEKIRRAQADARTSLLLRTRPDEQAWVLIVAAQQQLGQLSESADTLELLVERKPDSALYWQQLFATYSNLATETTRPKDAARWHHRALLTLERAQQHGHLATPQDHFNIIALHTTLQQYDRAAQLLEKGLTNGTIKNTRRHWELLSYAWQQRHDNVRAIDTLRRALRALPDDSELEIALARLYYAQEQPVEACEHLRSAVTRGNLERPGPAWFFLAYLAYELRRYDDAARWAETAAAQPDAQKEDVARLAQAIRDALREHPTSNAQTNPI